MLPGSTPTRKPRGGDGRATEIQRLIGRSLRAVIDAKALGPWTVHVDADVLEADGGTRTAAITAAFVAVADALRARFGDGHARDPPRQHRGRQRGHRRGRAVLDLDYCRGLLGRGRLQRRPARPRGPGRGPGDRRGGDLLARAAPGSCSTWPTSGSIDSSSSSARASAPTGRSERPGIAAMDACQSIWPGRAASAKVPPACRRRDAPPNPRRDRFDPKVTRGWDATRRRAPDTAYIRPTANPTGWGIAP